MAGKKVIVLVEVCPLPVQQRKVDNAVELGAAKDFSVICGPTLLLCCDLPTRKHFAFLQPIGSIQIQQSAQGHEG